MVPQSVTTLHPREASHAARDADGETGLRDVGAGVSGLQKVVHTSQNGPHRNSRSGLYLAR
jgi:hypothetical protein